MRRVLVLLVVAAAVAVWAGLAVPSDALTVDAVSLSHAQLNRELAAIEASPSWQCYLQANASNAGLTVPTTVAGVPAQAWSTPLTVQWTNQRTTELAVEQYVQLHYPAGLAPAALPAAQASLETAISDTIDAAYSESSGRFSCSTVASGSSPPSGAATLASMPAWFQHDQVVAEAADLALVHLVPSSLPTSGPGLEAWYAPRKAEFDTICFSYIAVANQQTANEVRAKVEGGLPFATAARRYSVDATTAKKGGALGCYGPSYQGYSTVTHYTAGVKVGGVSQVYPASSSGNWLFSVTKRTVNPLSAVRAAVVAAVSAINEEGASILAATIQQAAHVTVSSTIGTFVPTSSGGTIVAPTQPPAGAVLNATANSSS